MRPSPPIGERGAVLLVVVFLGAVLAVLVLQFTYLVSLDTRMASSFRDSEEAYCLARAGVARAMEILILDKLADLEESGEAEGDIEAEPVDTLEDSWAVAQEEIELGSGRVAFRIEDEERKFNLNLLVKDGEGAREVLALIKRREGGEAEEGEGAVPEGEAESHAADDEDNPWPEDEKMVEALEWFLEYLGAPEPEETSVNLANWVTSNDGGRSDYGESDPGYECKKAPMESVGEMTLVRDIGQALFRGELGEEIEVARPEDGEWPGNEEDEDEDEPFRGLRAYFTVYSDGLINLNTAGVEVIAAGIRSLDEDRSDDAEEVAACLVAARDELPFADLEEETLESVDCDLPAGMEKRFKVASDFFTILAEGRVGSSGGEKDSLPRSVCRVRAVVHRLDERMVILSWRVESPWEDYLAREEDETEIRL